MKKTRVILLGLIIIVIFVGILVLPPFVLNREGGQTPSPTGALSTIKPVTPVLPTPEAASTPDHFYVSSNGNDANAGSQTSPWQTIQFAVDNVQPGATIVIQEGQYSEGVHILKAGQADKPIILMAEEGAQVVIDGRSNPAISGETDYWKISGLELTSKADRTLRVTGSYWQIQKNKIMGAVYIWGNNNLFENNEVDGSQHAGNENGVMDDGPSSHHNIFRGNKVHDFELRGFWSQWLTHDNLFEANEVYNITAETGMGIDLDAASNVGYRHTVRGNIIHDCAQTGIELENSYASVVENNLVYNTGLEAIQVINYKGCIAAGENNQYGDAGGECQGDELDTIVRQNLIINGGRVGGIVSYHASGVKLYNNTVYGSSSGFYILGDASLSDNWDVQGNIFAHNTRVQISVDDPKSFSVDRYNLVFQADGDDVYEIRGAESNFYSLAEWQEAFNLGQDSIEADPLFVNPSLNDFRLGEGSPAVDAGIDLQIALDFESKPRPSGESFDIGVFER